MKFIQYEDKYKESLKEVCFITASKRYQENKEALFLLYLDYYLENEKENCFIAVNDNDEVVGYILSATNYKKYNKIYKTDYLNRVKEISRSFYKEAKAELFLSRFLKNKYPAHLHIDILPLWQRMGIGKELINCLKKKLIDDSINGIYLCCGYNNKNAQAFYQKMGFKKIIKSRLTGAIYSMLVRRED